MRKYFVHYIPHPGHDPIKAVMSGDSYRAIMTKIRKISECATILKIAEIPQEEGSAS